MHKPPSPVGQYILWMGAAFVGAILGSWFSHEGVWVQRLFFGLGIVAVLVGLVWDPMVERLKGLGGPVPSRLRGLLRRA